MTRPLLDVGRKPDIPIGRREFVRRAALLAVGAASAPLLAACDVLAPAPTATPVPATPAPTATAAATNNVAFSPTPAASAGASSPTPPSVTATVRTEPTEDATMTAQAAPTQPPQPAEPQASPVDTPTAVAARPQATASPAVTTVASAAPGQHGVALLASSDRSTAVPALLAMLEFAPGWLRGKRVTLKANFNSADPPPASTHIDTLRALLQSLQDWGASSVTLLERSGQGDTRQVLQQRGVLELASQFGADVVVLDELPARDWVRQEGAHWKRGFLFPRQVQEADVVVQTCCLKTHRYGGHFTMSLKNSVGMVAKFDPGDGYNYMGELHGSANQRLMIAEINAAYRPALILLDGVRAFVSGGPDQGKIAEAGVMLAGRDRVAVDAVGVAMLRSLGTTPEVSRGAIFDQPQIARAAALGLGAPDAASVTIHPAADQASIELAGKLRHLLLA